MPLTPQKEIGNLGEKIACQHLKENGYQILKRNFQKPWGEIDIIAQKQGIIIFIEVKTRTLTQNPTIPEQAVNYKKQLNLIKTAKTFIQQNKNLLSKPWQIDIIAVELNFKNRKADLRHFPNTIQEKL